MKRILCIVGTRPEGIKMAPIIRALRDTDWAQAVVLSTGQHREILANTLADFEVDVDFDLDLMEPQQTLASLTAKLFRELDPILVKLKPDLVLAQGDTTSVMVASVGCFYRQVPFGHVEAGLRTGDFGHPFPEEFNRVVAAKTASLHFAPTEVSLRNLLAEGVDRAQIFVTGNTVIDALLHTSSRLRPEDSPLNLPPESTFVLVTAHRRENFGSPIREICAALQALEVQHPSVTFVYPVHPNPEISGIVYRELQHRPGVILLPPVNYREMVSLLKASKFVLTDSGGLQEEAPAFAKPVLVLRNTTERPEAVTAGVVKVIGTSRDRIISEVSTLLEDDEAFRGMARGISPYGDGRASHRIVEISRAYLERGIGRDFV